MWAGERRWRMDEVGTAQLVGRERMVLPHVVLVCRGWTAAVMALSRPAPAPTTCPLSHTLASSPQRSCSSTARSWRSPIPQPPPLLSTSLHFSVPILATPRSSTLRTLNQMSEPHCRLLQWPAVEQMVTASRTTTMVMAQARKQRHMISLPQRVDISMANSTPPTWPAAQ